MSSINGSCGPSLSEQLLQKGFEQSQIRQISEQQQVNEPGAQGATASIAVAPVSEGNKGVYIDLYV